MCVCVCVYNIKILINYSIGFIVYNLYRQNMIHILVNKISMYL